MDFDRWWTRILHDLGSTSDEAGAKALAQQAWDAAKAQSGNYTADSTTEARIVTFANGRTVTCVGAGSYMAVGWDRPGR